VPLPGADALKTDHPGPEGTPPGLPSPRGRANLKLIAAAPPDPSWTSPMEWIAEISDVGRQIPRPIS